MKNFLLLLPALVFCSRILVRGYAAGKAQGGGGDPSRYNVVWTSPSTDHNGSMPLGNGDITLNAWVEESGDLLFYVGKSDSWDENGRLLKVGRVRVSLDPRPQTPLRGVRAAAGPARCDPSGAIRRRGGCRCHARVG